MSLEYKCECGKEYQYVSVLERHKLTCKYLKRISSGNIDKNQESQEDDNEHIEDKKGSDNKCSICNKEFANKFNMQRHYAACNEKNVMETNNISKLITSIMGVLTNIITEIEHTNNDTNTIYRMVLTTLLMHLIQNNNSTINNHDTYQALVNILDTIRGQNISVKSESVDQTPIIKQTSTPAPIPIIDIDVANSEINESDINSHNTTNTNCNNTNCNNTTTINYSPIIYPFGFENLNFLSQNERVELISSPNCLIDVLNKVYTHSENRNYHKRNMNRDQVTVIMENYDIKVFSDREYQDMMVKQLIKIVYILFYKSKNGLTFDKQATLWEKIKLMETMALECVDKDDQKQPKKFRKLIDNISGILATTNENINASNEFSEFKTKMNDTMYKDHLITLVGEITREFENYKKDLADVSITDEELRAFWTEPDEDISIESPQNNIERNELEDIYRYKYFKKMIEIENTKLNESIQSVGNINEVYNIRLKRAEEELELLKEHYKLSKIGMFPIRRFLLLDSLSESISKSQEIYNDILKLKQQEEKEAKELLEKAKLTTSK